jgi:hypothetical protein
MTPCQAAARVMVMRAHVRLLLLLPLWPSVGL